MADVANDKVVYGNLSAEKITDKSKAPAVEDKLAVLRELGKSLQNKYKDRNSVPTTKENHERPFLTAYDQLVYSPVQCRANAFSPDGKVEYSKCEVSVERTYAFLKGFKKLDSLFREAEKAAKTQSPIGPAPTSDKVRTPDSQ